MQVTFEGTMSERDVELCSRFGIRAADGDGGFRLRRADGQLQLVDPELGAFALDLQRGPLAHRLRTARRSEPLPRAVGLRRRLPRVCDATAGLGRDALVLAWLGCEVVAVEANGALAMLLADAVAQSPVAARLRVVHGDARSLLAGIGAEVVYLDPMFSEHGRAQVRKDAQLLRRLCGEAGDVDGLFAAARASAGERVVVKRSPGLAALQPADFSVAGGRVRFDVYLRQQA